MGRKRRKIPKIGLHPMFEWISGKMGNIVYRLSHNGEVSAYPAPDMTNIVWSPAQKAQRERFANAQAYTKLAIRDPEGNDLPDPPKPHRINRLLVGQGAFEVRLHVLHDCGEIVATVLAHALKVARLEGS